MKEDHLKNEEFTGNSNGSDGMNNLRDFHKLDDLRDLNDVVMMLPDCENIILVLSEIQKNIKEIRNNFDEMVQKQKSIEEKMSIMIENQSKLEENIKNIDFKLKNGKETMENIEKELSSVKSLVKPEEGESRRIINSALRQYAMGRGSPLPFFASNTHNPIGGI